jgi:hypothetical protein
MNVSCLWVTTADAATTSTIAESFFTDGALWAGDTYVSVCGGVTYINATLANAISAANGGDPIE